MSPGEARREERAEFMSGVLIISVYRGLLGRGRLTVWKTVVKLWWWVVCLGFRSRERERKRRRAGEKLGEEFVFLVRVLFRYQEQIWEKMSFHREFL